MWDQRRPLVVCVTVIGSSMFLPEARYWVSIARLYQSGYQGVVGSVCRIALVGERTTQDAQLRLRCPIAGVTGEPPNRKRSACLVT